MSIALLVYHWTYQKIKARMFFLLMAYMFLALIYNDAHSSIKDVSFIFTTDCLKGININYVMIGKKVVTKLEFKSNVAELMEKH